ncbi:MAG: hypothetical protein BJ554DRAFT_8126, partial [Olpidium bornovanus]
MGMLRFRVNRHRIERGPPREARSGSPGVETRREARFVDPSGVFCDFPRGYGSEFGRITAFFFPPWVRGGGGGTTPRFARRSFFLFFCFFFFADRRIGGLGR